MFISASLNSEYLLKPSGAEFRPFFRLFSEQVMPADQGYTFSTYDKVPGMTVQGAEYFGAIADKTRSFDNRQALLTNLKRCINIGNMDVIDSSQGIVMPRDATITATQLGVNMNHIPQLFAIYDTDKLLINFTGVFDFKTKFFRGQADFATVGEIWKE